MRLVPAGETAGGQLHWQAVSRYGRMVQCFRDDLFLWFSTLFSSFGMGY